MARGLKDIVTIAADSVQAGEWATRNYDSFKASKHGDSRELGEYVPINCQRPDFFEVV
jgi:hypothetical protein